jgi:hypothetical protein
MVNGQWSMVNGQWSMVKIRRKVMHCYVKNRTYKCATQQKHYSKVNAGNIILRTQIERITLIARIESIT